ncbi:hypothetical protein KY345_05630 [Candidatus Woesearchaeota archaeon]|nr:hypothetical protein [Candidatus Woesearchaeota archaeon]
MGKRYCHEHGTVIEKRIRKYVRLNKLFRKNDVIKVKDDISSYFVRKIIKNLPAKIVKQGKCDKVVSVWTADDEINGFFMNILGKKVKDEKNVKMFLWVTDEELEKYCKINKIKFKRNKKDKSVIRFVDEISLKFPDSKHKLIKSLGRLYSE